MTFEQAYHDHRPGLTRYLQLFCQDTQVEHDDLLQETWLQAWRHWSRRRSDNVRAWLIGIARRVFWRMRRDSRTKPEAYTITWQVEEDLRTEPSNPELAAYVAQLREKFSSLGPAQAEVLHATANGFRSDEIAELHGRSASAARMALSLGRKRLREMGFTG